MSSSSGTRGQKTSWNAIYRLKLCKNVEEVKRLLKNYFILECKIQHWEKL
jgi:FAD synthase